MPTAAYATQLKISGTSTSFTEEATDVLTPGFDFQISDDTKRILDPGVALTVEVDPDGLSGFSAATDPYTVDYLFGRIVFADDQGTDAEVRVSGNYLPTVTVAEAFEHTYTTSRNVLDTSNFDGNGFRMRTVGLADLSGSMRTYSLPEDQFQALYEGGTPLLVEEYFGSGDYFRAWVLLESIERGGGYDDAVATGISYVGSARAGTGETSHAIWGWGA